MKVSGFLHGGAPHLRRFQIAQTVSTVGIPMLMSTEAEAGLDAPTTTNAADMVGLNYDTATYVTAQQTDGSSAERTVLCCVNPDVILEAALSGGGTSGTQLTLYDVTAASTDGLSVTTGDDWTTPEFDDGTIWGYDGANAKQVRKITSTGATAATVTVAFDNDTVVGDNFLRAPFFVGDDQSDTVTLTATFEEVDASVATTAAGAALMPYRLIAEDFANNGRQTSKVLLIPEDHWLNKLS